MKTLYFDCGMGAAGDMLTAALLELLPDKEAFITELNTIGIPEVEVSAEAAVKCGIQGTHVTVKVNGQEETPQMYDHPAHDHDHEHSHTHEHSDDHEHNHTHEYSDNHDHEHSHTHDHSDGHDHEHNHTHEHSDEHDHEHNHTHDHSHDHDHAHNHAHHHSSLHDIEHIVEELKVSDKVKHDIMAVYRMVAEAESKAHGVPVTEIHFHEVGTMDAIADITAVCLLMEKIAPEQVVVSPIHVGSGQVKCAHGILPVPAPATAYILRGVPIYGGAIKDELCTPTGAALLKYFADSFGNMPVISIQTIGYGMGKKDFEAANCVRVLLGEAE